MFFSKLRRALQLITIVNILVTASLASAHQPSLTQARCFTAFPEGRAFRVAQNFFRQNQSRWSEIESHRQQAQTIVRETISELSAQIEMGQAEKAEYWRETVRMMRHQLGLRFMSEEFQGADGSLLFQGAKNGIAFVIGPQGDLYRGQLATKLDRKQRPLPIWDADYTGFKWLNPPPERGSKSH